MKEQYVDQIAYWIDERESIRMKREQNLPPPWTVDGIMQRYHFCNVHREDDRGTKEIHAVKSKLGVKPEDLPKFYTAARLFNKASTAELYWQGGIDAVKKYRDAGNTVFHTAYVVSTCGKRMDKVDYVERVIQDIARKPISPLSCAEAYRDLSGTDGLGSFLAGQIIADLKYTPYLAEVHDWWNFAVMGPGSKKGLDFIFQGGTTQTNFMVRLMKLRAALVILDGLPMMHNQDLQNCLCEFSKYMRYQLGLDGRRRPYHAHD
jgi:alpha-glutamyl/putrescinyl thymine pyrophosphorylase clade 1